MKKKFISTLTIAAMLLLPLFMSAQTDGPGNPGGEPGGGDVPIGGGAPVGNGIGILLALGAAYGGKKLYTLYHGQKETLEE
jgi:hypothetical protein